MQKENEIVYKIIDTELAFVSSHFDKIMEFYEDNKKQISLIIYDKNFSNLLIENYDAIPLSTVESGLIKLLIMAK